MKRILIIEDDPIISHIYRSRFEKEGFAVEVCGDGQAGYYRLYDSKPDALLLDLMLPKLNGIDLLKKVRAVREFEKMPIIVFTNAYVANMIHESFSAGASAVYNKSTVTPRQIIDVLAQLLNPQAPGAGITQASASGNVVVPLVRETKTNHISNADDTVFQKELLKTFEQTSQTAVGEMRKLLQETTKADETSRGAHAEQLYRKVRSFAANASMAGLPYLAKMGAALEALVKEMSDKPKNLTPSTLRTTAQAIDFFQEMIKPGLASDFADNPPIHILIVDDEMLSRRAIVYALEKAFLKATDVEDAEAALAKVQATKFDLIFLDVNLPGIDGFHLCDNLRQNGPNKTTPIIFVTGTVDFKVRAQSTLRGASDLIAKPFMFIELTVKSLTFALRHRIESQKQSRVALANRVASTPPEKAELIV